MVKLHGIKTSDPMLAQMIAEQVFDNTLVAAGLMDDSRVMLPRSAVLYSRGCPDRRCRGAVGGMDELLL